MTHSAEFERSRPAHSEAGYTLIELMIAVSILMIVSASVFNGVQQLTRVNDTVHNRSEMHAAVRNATELLQQEIGQAGKISLPGNASLAGAVAAAGVQTVAVASDAGAGVAGMFVGQTLTIDTGDNQESLFVTALDTGGNTITGTFEKAHAAGAVVRAEGGFFAGVVPKTYLNGSTDTVLKIFGDVNGDGKMKYVEYTCDVATGNLYRNSMDIPVQGAAVVKPAFTVSQALLNNIQDNPGGTPCFTYQEKTARGLSFVTDVAITLTVQTEKVDPVTGLYQKETKALLNVSPRNVFQVWQLATLNMTNRVQSVPDSVTALLALP